ncbi:MAG: methyltransferase domain-containing protein [Chloroherpetonaceae bacterium]|nr:methyltransferase domain-containing protein [Chloroherpetonaceae bacterium]
MNSIDRISLLLKNQGLSGVYQKILTKIFGKAILPNFKEHLGYFQGKSGIEIGGPSQIFRPNEPLPIYPLIGGLDGCNFSSETMWEGALSNEKPYQFHPGREGKQFISEASDLTHISTQSYDFLISSNCLEHIANPIKALREWIRVVKPQGAILVAVPNKDYCFDHRRPVTSFHHLLQDEAANMPETDMTHLEEILSLHDLSRDPLAGDFASFKARSEANFTYRGLHHHIFDMGLMKELFNYLQLRIVFTHKGGQDHVILGIKS